MSHFIIEEWKEFIPEFSVERRYFISNLGNLKVANENLTEYYNTKGSLTEGYRFLRFTIKIDGKKKNLSFSFHSLVAKLFIENSDPEKTKVIHLDYDKLNNVVSNLRWVTYNEMREHGYKSPLVEIGRKRALEKFGPKNTKLREIDVIRLKKKILDPNRKTRLRLIAKEFGISEMQLHRIKTGENWGHIKVLIK